MMKKGSPMLLFSVVFMDMVGFGFIIPLLPDYVARFGGAPALVGALASVYALGQFVAAPLVGRLSDRYGRKPLFYSRSAEPSSRSCFSGSRGRCRSSS